MLFPSEGETAESDQSTPPWCIQGLCLTKVQEKAEILALNLIQFHLDQFAKAAKRQMFCSPRRGKTSLNRQTKPLKPEKQSTEVTQNCIADWVSREAYFLP